MSAGFPRNSRLMRAHCVSRPLLGMSDGFLHDYSYFQPHCVSHCRPGKSPARSFPRASARHPQPHALGALVLGVGFMPALARTPVPLALALPPAADALAITRSGVGTEPSTTDATRA